MVLNIYAIWLVSIFLRLGGEIVGVGPLWSMQVVSFGPCWPSGLNRARTILIDNSRKRACDECFEVILEICLVLSAQWRCRVLLAAFVSCHEQ